MTPTDTPRTDALIAELASGTAQEVLARNWTEPLIVLCRELERALAAQEGVPPTTDGGASPSVSEPIDDDSVRCMDCGLLYREFGHDTTLPDEQWRMIHDSEGGILCANCMVKRATKLHGVIAMRAHFEFAVSEPDGHAYNAACHLAGCPECTEKFLEEHSDTLPSAARPDGGVEERVPICGSRGTATVSRSIWDEAWLAYAKQYGADKSQHERLLREGFYAEELDSLRPGWRPVQQQIDRLTARVRELARDLDIEKACNKDAMLPAPCGHPAYLCHSEDGGKNTQCYRCEKESAEARVRELQRDRDAARELLSMHNLGGMTDYNDGPMKRALAAERARDEAVRLLNELHTMVWGECPSLLNEDSGGNARLDLAIRAAIAGEKA